MSTQMFPKLLPVDIKFFGGESPSPQKLTGIYNYIGSAFYILESFLGNGVDLNTPSDADRKLIYNLSNAIGAMGNVYRPHNYLTSLEFIHRQFGSMNGNGTTEYKKMIDQFMQSGGTEKYLTVNSQINIPIDIISDSDLYLNMLVTGAGIVRVHHTDTSPVTDITISTPISINGYTIPTEFSLLINAGVYISHIEIIITVPTVPINFFSLTLVDSAKALMFTLDTANKPYNVSYAMNQNNPSFWKIKKPCQNALDEVCSVATCKYCIGNTYDIYTRVLGLEGTLVGESVCGGDFASTIQETLQPVNKTTYAKIKYTPPTTPGTSTLYTAQSSLLMKETPYSLRFRPYGIHSLPSESIIDKNQAMVYDSFAGGGATSPLCYNLIIQSGGRPDIVIINDTKNNLVESKDRFIILGGMYSLASYIADTSEMSSARASRAVAVYAD